MENQNASEVKTSTQERLLALKAEHQYIYIYISIA